jgi:hypothetical protein
MIVLGDKDKFAIEYEPYPMSNIRMVVSRIWVQGNYFGNIKDPGPVSGLLKCFGRLIDNQEKFQEPDFSGKTPHEILSLIFPYTFLGEDFFSLEPEEQDRLDKYQKFFFQFGEGYDDFMVGIFLENNVCHFIWQLWIAEDTWNFYVGYDREIHHRMVSMDDLTVVFDQFRREMNL